LGYTIQFFKISNLQVVETFVLQEEKLLCHIPTISLYFIYLISYDNMLV
jgi:hypothetical protein